MKAVGPASPLAVGALALCLLLQSGCITRNLWEQTYFAPARPSNIRLYESVSPPGVLVEYDERIAGGHPTGRRAYLIQPDAAADTDTPPAFIAPVGDAAGLKPILVWSPGQVDALPRESGYAAVGWSEENEFVLYRDGQSLGTHKLPFYWKPTKPVGRALLTPATVAADTTYFVGVWTAIVVGSMHH